MLKPENKISWKDSNLALFGSDLEKKIKAASAGLEKAWDGLGNGVAFRVWRIEKFLVKDWPKRKHGKFHTGDSYIVLNSYKVEDKICHDIHIWIGDESSQDEYGTAAYKMVELDNRLGGTATQHREVQGHESKMFLDYFGGKVTYLAGGIESGFRHVEPDAENPHLYKIKGHVKAGTLRMTQEPLRRDAMNSGDVFVLVAGDDAVWLWVGTESNQDEKTKGMEVARAFCKKGSVIVLDEGTNDGVEEAKEFWARVKTELSVLGPLPIKKSIHIQSADDKDDKGSSYMPTLFKIPEKLGAKPVKTATATMTPSGPSNTEMPKIKRGLLQDAGAYLLDTGFHVYIWLGSTSAAGVRSSAVHYAETYFKSYKRPVMPVSIIKQGQREAHDFSVHFVEGGADSGCACVIQ